MKKIFSVFISILLLTSVVSAKPKKVKTKPAETQVDYKEDLVVLNPNALMNCEDFIVIKNNTMSEFEFSLNAIPNEDGIQNGFKPINSCKSFLVASQTTQQLSTIYDHKLDNFSTITFVSKQKVLNYSANFSKSDGNCNLVLEINEIGKKTKMSYEDFLSQTYEHGKALYNEKIVPLKNKMVPIQITGYTMSMDSANGVDISIDYKNISNKTFKYVIFEITPYNRVDDVAYSTIGHISKTSVQAVDYVEPDTEKRSCWEHIWYNPSISYFKINSVKVIFKDGSEISISSNDMQKVFENDTAFEFDSKISSSEVLKIKYFLASKLVTVLCESTEDKIENFEYIFDMDEKIALEPTKLHYTNENPFTVSRFYDLAAVKSGVVKGSRMSHNFTEEELQFLRDCISIKYYAD